MRSNKRDISSLFVPEGKPRKIAVLFKITAQQVLYPTVVEKPEML